VAAGCDRAVKEIKEPALKELRARIRDHELYHVDVFNDLLKEEEGRGRKRYWATKLTLRSLTGLQST
jgi:hypothetical protein